MYRVKRATPSPALVLTGIRHRSRIEVRRNDIVVPLSCASFEVLVDLVLALINTETGYLPHEAVAVCRLRDAIDRVMKKGAGAKLIETGMSGQYRLTIPLTEIALTPCFFELVDLRVVTEEQADELRAVLRTL